jgi:hypothetical protein
MRDRQSSEIFMQLTRLSTGNGGSAYTLTHTGKFEGMTISDTLNFFVEPNVSDNTRRKAILTNVKRALLPYIINTYLIDNIDYQIAESIQEIKTEVEDPWDAWVFSVGANGNIQSQSNSQNTNINLRTNVNRTTDDDKFYTSFRYNESNSKFNILKEDGEIDTTIRGTNYSFRNRTLYVHSLNEKWSAGFFASYLKSIFSNYNHSLSFSPAIEYNIYPYSEAAKRQFALRYEVGIQYNDYVDSTFLLQTNELLFKHNFSVDFSVINDWGNLELDIFTNHFINRPKYWSIGINPNIEVNLLKGLSIDMGAFYSITKDLIQIPKGSLSLEDVLLQNRQLNTNFNFEIYFGINYRFGSSINNVVNTRF